MTWHHMCLQICKNAKPSHTKNEMKKKKKKKKIDLNLVKDNMGY